jgi:hypothetical protein
MAEENDTGVSFGVEGIPRHRPGQLVSRQKVPLRLRTNPITTTATGQDYFKLGKLVVTLEGSVHVSDSYPVTAENLALIRDWIDACANHHVSTTCQPTGQSVPQPSDDPTDMPAWNQLTRHHKRCAHMLTYLPYPQSH